MFAKRPAGGSNTVWSADSARIAYLTAPGKVDVWDLAAGKVIETWQAGGAEGTPVLRWPGKLTLVENIGGAIRIWRGP